jgi:hypothetical protein
MSMPQLLDAAGRRRSPATLPGFHAGRPPRNKGFRYPPDPPRVEEIIAVMRQAGETDHGLRLRALIVVLWRVGLRIAEALALTEPDLDPGRGSVLVCQGKGGKRREVGMDVWGFHQLQPWMERRLEMPVWTMFCVIDGQTRGRPWTPAAARNHLRRVAARAGVRRRSAPHQLRHAHAVEMAREGVSLKVIQRQLGHMNLGVTSVYLDGIDTAEIIDTVHNRRPPMISASAGLTILIETPLALPHTALSGSEPTAAAAATFGRVSRPHRSKRKASSPCSLRPVGVNPQRGQNPSEPRPLGCRSSPAPPIRRREARRRGVGWREYRSLDAGDLHRHKPDAPRDGPSVATSSTPTGSSPE